MNKKAIALGGILVAGLLGFAIWRQVEGPASLVSREIKSTGATITANEIPASPLNAKERYTLGVLFPTVTEPFWAHEAYGVIDQAKKLGVKVVWQAAGGPDKLEVQDAQIKAMIEQRVDAILLAPISYTGSIHIVEDAAAARIPLITHGTLSESDKVAVAVINDEAEIGRSQARALAKALDGKGTVAMLNGPMGIEWSARRVDGFMEVLTKDYPDIKAVVDRFGNFDREESQRVAADLLAAFPDLSAIFTVHDTMALGAADAVAAAQRTGKVQIVTAAFSRETLPYIADGRILAAVDDNAAQIGRTAVNFAVRALNGEAVPKKVLMTPTLITKENLSEVDANAHWPSADWKLK